MNQKKAVSQQKAVSQKKAVSEEQVELPIQCDLINTALNELGEDEVRDKWPDLLIEHVDVITAALMREKGMKKAEALELAYFIVDITARHHDGRNFYLPTGERLDSAIKHKRIFNDWYHGMELADIARKYKMKELALYKIINQQRKLHRKKIETSMPGIPTEEEFLESIKE